MEKYTKLTGIAAPMPLVNIDTDMIIPKVFLKTIKRSGLGVNLFDEMRYDRDGNEIADFVLNKPQYRDAEILVAGDNFGCGSSREYAPRALYVVGLAAVIAPSFSRIFYRNALNLGLPLFIADLTEVLEDGQTVTFDLDHYQIVPEGNAVTEEGAIALPAPADWVRTVWREGGIVQYYVKHGRLPVGEDAP